MDERIFVAIAILGLFIAVAVGIVIGVHLSDDTSLLRDAGIKRIVRCYTSSSNWVEIVWTDGRVTKGGSK